MKNTEFVAVSCFTRFFLLSVRLRSEAHFQRPFNVDEDGFTKFGSIFAILVVG